MAEAKKVDANATVVRSERLAGCLFRLWIRPDWALAETEWEAGQFVRLAVLGDGTDVKKESRAYSFVGVQDGVFEFYFVKVEGGLQTPKLHGLGEGDRVWCEQKIQGHFTLHANPEGKPDCFMIATGAGIAPFMAQIRHGDHSAYEKVVLVHQVREVDHLAYGPELAKWVQGDPKRRYVPILSKPAARFVAKDGHAALFGRVGEHVDGGAIEAIAGTAFSADRTIAMLCGNPDMIKDVRERLEAKGLKKHLKRTPGNIVSERYW